MRCHLNSNFRKFLNLSSKWTLKTNNPLNFIYDRYSIADMNDGHLNVSVVLLTFILVKP